MKDNPCTVTNLCIAWMTLREDFPLCVQEGASGLVEQHPDCEILTMFREWQAEQEAQSEAIHGE